jgi:hypothetical protein
MYIVNFLWIKILYRQLVIQGNFLYLVPQPHPTSCQCPLINHLAVAANTVKDDKPKWTGWGDTTAFQPQTNGKVSLASIMKSEESAHDIRGMKSKIYRNRRFLIIFYF